jgi:DNA-binding CsgD family transcriptional regulator/tetratricopeptide (TPR) repeat protein
MLIERAEPLAAMTAAAAKAAAGHGHIVLLGGEAGIGKTSLVRAFAAKADGTVLVGGCEALFTARPLGPLQDIAEAISPALAALLERVAPQERIFTSLLDTLQKPALTRVLVLEDVHWADNATLDLIKFLGRRIPALRAVLILTFRSDEIGASHRLSEVLGDLPSASTLRLMLKPLTREGVDELARQAGLESRGVFEATAGNPFFVTELLANASGAATLPASVRDAVWARLGRLGPSERRLLDCVSISPGGAEDWLAAELAGEGAETAADACVARGLLARDAGGALRFRHELARAATLEQVASGRQRALHARAGAILGTRRGIALSRLAHHAAGAGDSAGVLAFAPRAAKEASKLGAHREAAAHYAAALDHAHSAAPDVLAQLLEDWSHEAGLALEIGDAVIAARKRAVELWRGLRRSEKVVLNLRWLSRLHWLRGESEEANRNLDAAIAAAEGLPPSPETAMALSARSQMLLINDYCAESIEWGLKALEMAAAVGDIDTRIHSLNNVGVSRLFLGREGGEAMMEESIALALEHGFHEHAARGYTNYTGYAVDNRKFALAERYSAAGIAFTRAHDLDAEMHYLVGLQSEFLFEQGRYAEAEASAQSVLRLKHVSLVCRFPALLVEARIRSRLGDPGADRLLEAALADAIATGEPQNMVPSLFALAEAAWLSDDYVACRALLRRVAGLRLDGFDTWQRGELASWWRRAAMPEAFPLEDYPMAAPHAAEASGGYEDAAGKWLALGVPYDAALSLMQSPSGLARAVEILDGLGDMAAADLARARARESGIAIAPRKARRGSYGAARTHPLGLTQREIDVLALMAQGLGNTEIARKLVRSQRTVEHHVSSLLGKLNAPSRLDAVLRLRNEPWLLPEQKGAA